MSCIKLAKTAPSSIELGLAEWTRAGADGEVVMGSNPA